MKVWVTGEAGFISRHISGWSIGKEIEIVNSLDEAYYDYWRNFQGVNSLSKEIDIFDPVLEKIIKKSEADVILHTAAITDKKFCQENPEAAIRINIEGVAAVARIAKKLDIPFVFISSADIIKGETIFDVVTGSAEQIVAAICDKWTIVTPGYLYGECDKNGAISQMFYGMKSDETPVICIDPDHDKPFTYIDNFLDGLEYVLMEPNKFNHQDVEIGSPSMPFQDVLEEITEFLGIIPPFSLNPSEDYSKNVYLNTSTIEDCGWEEKITFEESLKILKNRIIEG